MSLNKSIKNRIKRKPDLWVFSAADFVDLGTRTAAEKVLSRCCHAGFIDRITQGLYMRPVIDPMFGFKSAAPLDNVAKAIQIKDNVIIAKSNAFASNILKMTNVIQAKPVYLTTGKSKTIKINGRDVIFKSMGNKLKIWIGSPAFTAVQSLFWLGKEMLINTPALRDRFWNNIGSQAQIDLIRNKNKLPMWAQTVIRR